MYAIGGDRKIVGAAKSRLAMRVMAAAIASSHRVRRNSLAGERCPLLFFPHTDKWQIRAPRSSRASITKIATSRVLVSVPSPPQVMKALMSRKSSSDRLINVDMAHFLSRPFPRRDGARTNTLHCFPPPTWEVVQVENSLSGAGAVLLRAHTCTMCGAAAAVRYRPVRTLWSA